MGKKLPIFYSALLLTGVNLLLRFAGTSFQVYLSGKIGASGIGLLQLVLSVGSLMLTIGMGGIRTATMYLCAEVVGQKRQDRMMWVLSSCILYSMILSTGTAILLYHFAPWISTVWIGNRSTTEAICLLSKFLPVNCLCGVMVGYFTGVNRIGTLAAVEVAEQLFSMLSTILLLTFWAAGSPSKACQAVIMGGGLGACFTLTTLLILKSRNHKAAGPRIPTGRKLLQTAVPLAVADNVKAGISATENLMVPKRLALFPAESAPLASFGMVCGMVFPLLMFPAAILFGLAELLIPELARCNAAGSHGRIRHLTQRSLLLSLIYGAFCSGILYLSSQSLCSRLYATPEAGEYLRWFSFLTPMLYCDAIVDAATKGLGRQKNCVRYNILTSAMDVVFLYLLLPKYAMKGYFFSFVITHLINFCLSIRLLTKIVGKILPIGKVIACLLSTALAVLAAGLTTNSLRACGIFTIIFVLLAILFGIIKKADLLWIRGLLRRK